MENFDENLENEYRKRFKNFDEMPDDLLWEKIQARIKPEKERPFIIWWTQTRGPVGIAASVLIGLLIGAYFFIESDAIEQIGNLPKKPDKNAPQSQKPDTTPKVNPAESAGKSGDKTGNALSGESQPLASAKVGTKKTTPGTKPSHRAKYLTLPGGAEEQQGLVAYDPLEKKAAGMQPIAVNPIMPESKTEKPVVVENTQTEEAKTVLAHHETDKVKETAQTIAENPADKTGLAVDINALTGKEAQQLAITAKPLTAPQLPATEMPIPQEERRRLVFIPPTELFANVTSTLSYYMFSPNKGDQILVNNFSSTSQRLGFAAQLGFVYPLAKKIDLRTGLSYFQGKSRISYGITDNSQKSVTVLNDNSIQINPGKSTKDESRNWQYFELQSDVLYEVKKMQALSVGMKFGVQTSAISKPLLQARLGYRVSKAIANHWALWLEPTVLVSLSSQQSIENLFMYRTTGFGLNMGVSLLK